MDDVEEQETKTRTLRKRKAITAFKESDDSASSDNYNPPKYCEDDSSEDSSFEVKRKVKKYKKKETSPNDAHLGAKEKQLCMPRLDFGDDGSNDSVSDSKKKVKGNTKRKTNRNGATQEVKRRKSKGRGRPPLDKSTVQGMKKGKKQIGNIIKEKNDKSQQIQKKNSRCRSLGPFSVIGHWYIASGFMKDLAALFTAFDEQDSWRFTAFATCWRNCQFSLIYRGRFSFKELLEFTEEIFFWTKKFLSPLHKMKWRVGALYALYGLYYKYPFRHFFKIRMDIEEYEHLVSLAGSFQSSAENPDPAFIFYKLKADSILIHVASSDEMGLSLYPLERQQEIMNYEMQWVLQEHSANAIFPERERTIQKTLLQEYEKVKSQTWGDSNGPYKAMSYVQPNILSEVDAVLVGMHEDTHLQPATHSQAASAEISEIGQRKGEVRKKAAAQNTTEEFLKRKLLRSPQKSYKKKDNQLNRKSLAGSASDDTCVEVDMPNVYVDSNQAMKLEKIMEFMQPTKEGALTSSLRSFRTKKNRTQKHQTEEESDPNSDVFCEISDSQDILLPNESPEQNEELEAIKKDGNTTSLQQLKGRRGRPRKSRSPQKAVQSEKSPLKRNTRTSLPKITARKGRPRRGSLKNTSKCEPHENSQITERNEFLEQKGEPEYLSKKNVSIVNASVNSKQKELLNLNDKVLHSETYSLGEQNTPENAHKQINSVRGSKERLGKLNKSRKVPSYSIEERISSAGVDEEYSSIALVKKLSGKPCGKVCDDQVISSEIVCEEVLDEQTITGKNYFGDSLNDKSERPTKVSPGVCHDDTIMNHQQNDASTSHSIDDMENTLNLSEVSCSDMNQVGKVLQVEILARTPKKKNLKSVLKAESMVYLEVNFQENNAMVHSAKFKMSTKDLKTLHSDKKKVDGLKKRLYSFVPPKYKNYELHLQFTIHQSVIEATETSEKNECELRSYLKSEKHSKQNSNSPEKHKQGSEPLLENPFRQGFKPSPEKHSKQAYEPTLVLPETSGTVIKTINAIPHEELLTSCTQKEKGSSHITEGNHIASSLSHGTCNDTNLVEKVLEVELVASFPKKNKTKSIPKAEINACLNINFQVEGVTIHNVKFRILESDLEKLQTNKKKLESLKAKFCSLLPPKYQQYKMQLRLSGLQSVTEGNETLEHSRQGSDSSAILAQTPATVFQAENTTFHTKCSTPYSQKGLSKMLTYNEMQTSCSKSSAPQVPQKVCNTEKVKGYYSSKPADQGQSNTISAAKPIQTTLDSLPLQGTTESPVGLLLISEGSHHPESFNSLDTNINLSNTQNTLPELLQMQNQVVICINEVTSSSPYYCSSEDPANVNEASVEESKTVQTQYQILPYEEEIVPTTLVESKPVNMNVCQPDIIYIDGKKSKTTQSCGTVRKACPPKLLDSERSMLNVHADTILEEPGHGFMHNISITSLPARESNANPEKCIEPNLKEKKNHGTVPIKKCTNEPDTEKSTILWKAASNSNTMNHKKLLISLPFKDSSSGYSKRIREEQRKTPSKTVRMMGNLSLNESSSRDNNTPMKDVNVLSAGTSINVSKANSNSICSFYFFSKRNKCDLFKSKQKRPSSTAEVKKPCVPFLFMEKFISKKEL